jgi:glycine cleavage system H protein
MYRRNNMAYKYHPEARYAKSHEWARMEGNLVVVGISDYAQHLLSDVVYVELPEVGDTVTAGESMATVESVKAAEDAYAPVSGEVLEVNADLESNPEWINSDPYGKAWMAKISPSKPEELEGLMTATAYEQFVQEEEEKGAH